MDRFLFEPFRCLRIVKSIEFCMEVLKFEKDRIKIRRIVDHTIPLINYGGAEEDRTPDLLNAIQALSQLSYNPTFEISSS